MHNNIPQLIQILLLEKCKARAKWQNSKYPNDKIKLNQLSNKLKKVIWKHKNDSYNSYVEALTTTNCSLWKATKSLLRLNQPSPLRKADNSWAITDLEKSNIFAEHLSKCFIHHDIRSNVSQLEIVDSSLNSPLPMSLPAKYTSPGEIEYIIKQLPIKKSPGHNLISNVITRDRIFMQ